MRLQVKLTWQEIIDKMRNGWELGCMSGCRSGSSWSLQQGKQGYGGDSIHIHASTARALIRRKLIKQHYGFPTSTFTLIEQ